MIRKPVIAIDMDDTLCYLMKAIMEDHNSQYPKHKVSYEQIIAFDESMFHKEYSKYDFLNKTSIYEELNLLDEYVVSEMKKMNELYDIVIVTAAFAPAVVGKWNWIQKHLPFIPFKNFIVSSRKDLIEADILIDDAKHNIQSWSKKGKPSIVLEHHWNKDLSSIPNTTMKKGWSNMSDLVDTILKKHYNK